VSIINNFKAINEAMQPREARSNGRPICHECYCDLGNPAPGSVVTCKSCGETNYVEE
jgi:hypothetical protein